jgi:exosortase A
MTGTRDRWLLVAFVLAMASLGWAYYASFASIAEKWDSDATFSHGYLIIPVSLWLAWRKRNELRNVAFAPSWIGLVLLAAATAMWIVARGVGVIVLEQFAVAAMIPALVLTVLGWPVTRVLIVPLLFLFFAVPFGRGIVPLLMQQTADVSTWLLQLTGIPVHRSYMYVTIPAGQFEVAKACSGLNYFITGIVLGTLYAYLTYSGWKKRLLCILAFTVVPLILNGLRVFAIVLVSYWTDMRFGPGQEHVVFGRAFFIVVMLVMFWIGRRWADEPPAAAAAPASPSAPARWPPMGWAVVALAFVAILAGPLLLDSSVARASARLADASRLIRLPAATAAWQGPADGEGRWRPSYHDALTEQQAVYRREDGAAVDVFVAVYGLGVTQGAEMISYQNTVSPMELGSLVEAYQRRLVAPSGVTVNARELTMRDSTGTHLVWHWFVVGEHATANEYKVKALEAVAFLTRGADSERIVTLSTPLDEGARERLQSFFDAHAECAASGFAAEACGG